MKSTWVLEVDGSRSQPTGNEHLDNVSSCGRVQCLSRTKSLLTVGGEGCAGADRQAANASPADLGRD